MAYFRVSHFFMKKNFYLPIVFCLLSATVFYGQEEGESIDTLIDEIFDETFTEEEVKELSQFHMLYTSVTYNDQTYFAGRSFEDSSQYGLVPQISYIHSSGFSLSTSALFFSEFDPQWDTFNLSVGYSKYIGKHKQLGLSANYSRFFFNEESGNVFDNGLGVGLSLRSKNKLWSTSLRATLLFGNESTYQLVSNTSYKWKIFKKGDWSMVVRPQITFFMSEQTIDVPIGDTEDFSEGTVFDLINTQLVLPIEFDWNRFDFGFTYHYNLPNPVGLEEDLDNTHFFSLDLGYFLDF